MKDREQFIDPYIQQLGLTWRVETEITNTDRPTVVSSKADQLHHIEFPRQYATRLQEFRFDVIHELIHGKFAESLDPIFSTVYFHPEYDTADQTFQKKSRQLYYAQQLIDVWVGDYMSKIDPKLAGEDVQTWLAAVSLLSPSIYAQMPYELIVGYAVNQAQITRNGLNEYESEQQKVYNTVGRTLGKPAASMSRDLARLFKTLPELPVQNKAEALELFETSTQEAARILQFPIAPQLREVNGTIVWKVD